MADYTDAYWTSPDGLRLHYRDYPGSGDRAPILCLPGLTRNARDFEPVAEALGGDWRLICPDLRGRGGSEYAKDAMSYIPATYIKDLEALFEQTGLDRFVVIGTSLGGILTMLLAAGGAGRIAGAVLNDIGPVTEPEGIARVRNNVGRGSTFPTWMHAARALQESQGDAFPDYSVTDWLRTAKRRMALGAGGRVSFDYDMKIAEPFHRMPTDVGAILWPAYEALAGRPLLVLRGGVSDLLSAETLAEMGRRVPAMEGVTVPRVGHAPALDEPEAQAALARLLARVS